MDVLKLNITDKKYIYGRLILEKHKIEESLSRNTTYVLDEKKTVKRINRIKLDCAVVHYLVKELKLSTFYRISFIIRWVRVSSRLVLVLKQTKYDLIDYNWNDRVFLMVRERCELDHALSWLSTLGGAFSALGDYFPNCADIAGKISINQLKLALRLGDPSIASRCRLYLSLSLIQKKKYRYARRIVQREYYLATNATVVDHRLLNMCRGIWSKLQYEHWVFGKKTAIIW